MKVNIIFTFLLFFAHGILNGQPFKLKNPIPKDTSWRTGLLKNGIHYYVKNNNVTEDVADFYIIYNVGSLQENEKQSGLAHFTEHLAFASNKKCPKNKILDYLKDIGLKEGADLNAHTSLTNTSYEIRRVPMGLNGILDTIIQYIKLNATCMALDSNLIEQERKIILEEWRKSDNANRRIAERMYPTIFQGSRYAKPLTIGDTAILKHFKHQELRDFYSKWYRADYINVIAIGDFDAQKVETKIKEELEKIPAAITPCPLEDYSIPDNKNPIIAIKGDSEAQETRIEIFYKHDPENPQNLNWLKNRIIDELIVRMRQKRIFERTHLKNSVITKYDHSFLGVPNKWAYSISAGATNGKAINCLKDLLIENERAYRFGFTVTEIEKAKASLLRTENSRIKDIDRKPNNAYLTDCFNNIVNGIPLVNSRYKNTFLKSILPLITQEEINDQFKSYITRKNMVVSISGPQNTNLPSENEVKDAIDEVKLIQLPPYVDLSEDKRLFNKNIVPGSIIETKIDSTFGTTEWKLSNGIQVIIKQTNFNNNEIKLLGMCPGGMATINDTSIVTGNYFSKITEMMGVGDMSNIELGEYLSGNVLRISPVIFNNFDGIEGSCSPKDFETFLQLVHLYFAKPRSDEEAFDKFVRDEKNSFPNRNKDPKTVFYDSVQFIRGNRSFRARPYNPNELSLKKFQKLYREHFSDPTNFTFLIAGNINPMEDKLIIEKYLGSLKSINIRRNQKNSNYKSQGQTTIDFKFPLKISRTSVHIEYSGEIPSYTLKDFIYLNLIDQILEEECMKTLRYKQQGVYSVDVSKFLSNDNQVLNLGITFSSDPSQADNLKKLAKAEVDSFLVNGPKEQSLSQAREHFFKNNKLMLKDNSYWINLILVERYFKGLDFLTEYNNILKKVTSTDLKLYLQAILSNKNVFEVTMRPKD